VVAEPRRGAEALEVAVARVAEPDRAERLTTTSLGEFSGSSSKASTSVSTPPVARSTSVIAAAVARVPCSQTTRRPSWPRVIPFATFASSRRTETVRRPESAMRLIDTRSSRRTVVT
jgi:hypothetical protein